MRRVQVLHALISDSIQDTSPVADNASQKKRPIQWVCDGLPSIYDGTRSEASIALLRVRIEVAISWVIVVVHGSCCATTWIAVSQLTKI